jgi:hypothetical protein
LICKVKFRISQNIEETYRHNPKPGFPPKAKDEAGGWRVQPGRMRAAAGCLRDRSALPAPLCVGVSQAKMGRGRGRKRCGASFKPKLTASSSVLAPRPPAPSNHLRFSGRR